MSVCSVADTSLGRWALPQEGVDRIVRNSAHALVQLDDKAQAEGEASPKG